MRRLPGVTWEAVFVDDDSPDGTAAEVRSMAAGGCPGALHPPDRAAWPVFGGDGGRACLPRRCIIAVIDGDLQHDETRLPDLLAAVRSGADLAVGSRHVPGGDAAGLAGAWRERVSAAGTGLAQRVLPVRLLRPDEWLLPAPPFAVRATGAAPDGPGVQDPARPRPVRRRRRCGSWRCRASFRPRMAGRSKLDVLVMLQFAALLLDKADPGACCRCASCRSRWWAGWAWRCIWAC